jgi:hypothetical protein
LWAPQNLHVLTERMTVGSGSATYPWTYGKSGEFEVTGDIFVLNPGNISIGGGVPGTSGKLTMFNGYIDQSTAFGTFPPHRIVWSGSPATNALEYFWGTPRAGIESNGVAWLSISNSPVKYPANYTVFDMNADGSVTNITTTTNTIWGTGKIGSVILTNGFFTIADSRQIKVELEGNYWTQGTNGNSRFVVMLNTASATNTLDTKLFTPTASKSGDSWYLYLTLTPRSLGASGTIEMTGTMITLSAGAPTYQNLTNSLTTIDTTVAYRFDIGFTNGASGTSWQAKSGGMFLR